MQLSFDPDSPIFQQIAEAIEDAIFTGAFAEEEQIPSTTEVSAQLKINPATVLKGMNILVDRGILYKKRGVGMFVRAGAALRIKEARREGFLCGFVQPLLKEAEKLGLTLEEICAMIEGGLRDEPN